MYGLKILIIGAGPAGLIFARSALIAGAEIIIIEQAGDPRRDDAGYTDRSFNLTLNSVGRKVINDSRVWNGGIDLKGRAVHSGSEVKYAEFGDDDSVILTSIPRPLLRQNLVNLVEENGATFIFRNKVILIDENKGIITILNEHGIESKISGDLIVVADGVHSLADNIIENVLKGKLNLKEEHLKYLKVMLPSGLSEELSTRHIHFWQEPGSKCVAIGIPNNGGTVSALLISSFENISENGYLIKNLHDAEIVLRSDFSQIFSLCPDIAIQITGKKAGSFYYKSISDYVLGKKCIVLGDAGSASPPWAGFGANTAIYGADALVRFIIGLNGNLEQAMITYQEHKFILAELVLDYAEKHGEFLNTQVTKDPSQRPIGPVLGELINKAIDDSYIPNGVELLRF